MLELLSPAGSMDALRAAVQNGADAVYLGLASCNARQGARNFSPDELREAVKYCHIRGVKVHLTLNTLLSDREMPQAAELIRTAAACDVDAFIVQDLGVVQLCRQIARLAPKRLIIFDIYENNAYNIQQELHYTCPELDLVTLIGSVRDRARIESVFAQYRPQVVCHAAAHKHVPLMEDSPNEAVKNNIFGTLNTARAADRYGAEAFVLISTDKAVNPTNVMGASKRVCEMIVQVMGQRSKTRFAAVRFGNVLGSNGSVIPLFKSQIEHGGPVTVTHRDIIRYFMTIPEAVSLVLQTCCYAKDGEVFVLDMGEPVRIDDLARNMIRLSGFEPDVDIPIVYTGLRPGEKLFEELLMTDEGLDKTANELIFVGHFNDFDRNVLLSQLDELAEASSRNSGEIRALLQKIVPTYHPARVQASAPEAGNKKDRKLARVPVAAAGVIQ